MTTALTAEKAMEIGNAYKRLMELSQNKILSPSADAEKAKLLDYITTNVQPYLGELLGCWFAIRQEYEPLINNVAMFLNRVAMVTEAKQRGAGSVEGAK